MIRHLFWDFDGTLYDSYPQVAGAFWKGLQALGLAEQFDPEWLMKQIKVSVFYTTRQCAEKCGVYAQTIMESYRVFHDKETVFPPYEGLETCLRRLHEAGFRHYLYTHRNHTAIEQLKADGLWELFSDAVTSDDGFATKPAPDALLALMERNRLTPDMCAMVGDRDIDIEAGHNAGMTGVLFDPDGFYAGYPAELTAQSMQELTEKVLAK